MPLHGEELHAPMWKPRRGSAVLEREQRAAGDLDAEKAAKAKAKARDGFRCQWPERHKCRGGLEAAHIVDDSRGGAMDASNLIALCAWIHRRGPESIHSKDLRVELVSPKHGANGRVKFYRRVWSETRAQEFTWRLVGER